MDECVDEATLICRILRECGQSIAVAESLTTGRVQMLLGSVSGASLVFAGGITTYMAEQKIAHLGVDREHAVRVDAVSERVALEMARGVRAMFGVPLGIATTGYAEPAAETGIESPHAFIAVDVHGRAWCRRLEGGAGSRVQVQRHVAIGALRHLVECLRLLAAEEEVPGDLGRLQRATRDIERGRADD